MIYLDHHATTPCHPHAAQVMLKMQTENFGNPHSRSHEMGRDAATQLNQAIQQIADSISANASEIICTSGATEANNLAIKGVMLHPSQRRRRVVTLSTEHPAVLDPLRAMQQLEQIDLTILPVTGQSDQERCGRVDLDQLRDALDDDTALVSIMWANNEIGVLQPIREIAEICHHAGALLHCDAAQFVGRSPVDVREIPCDLLSASAHKFYGPKGAGFLYVRGRPIDATGHHGAPRRVKLMPQIEGGGQQANLRSGTMNAPAVVAMASALEYSLSLST
ncbi:MAG: cysteine desulfurase family protein, partial [Planctomycetota bacterium]